MTMRQQLLNILVREEIERVVAEAAQRHGFLRVGEHAFRIAKKFPGVDAGELFDAIVREAAHAGVAVEIYHAVAEAA